jgi:hypothetical protein
MRRPGCQVVTIRASAQVAWSRACNAISLRQFTSQLPQHNAVRHHVSTRPRRSPRSERGHELIRLQSGAVVVRVVEHVLPEALVNLELRNPQAFEVE